MGNGWVAATAALVCAGAALAAAELRWSPVVTSNPPPPLRGFAVGHDAPSGSVFLFGGKPLNAATWRLDLATRTWTQVNTSGTPPQARFSMVYGMEPVSRRWVGEGTAGCCVGWLGSEVVSVAGDSLVCSSVGRCGCLFRGEFVACSLALPTVLPGQLDNACWE
jgi:hypothetical protein